MKSKLFRKIVRSFYKRTGRRDTVDCEIVSADQLVAKAAESAVHFYDNPSLEVLTQTMDLFETALDLDPENWQALHQYQSFTSCAGMMKKCIELSERCLQLKAKLQKDADLHDLGFSVIPPGISAAIGHMAHLDGVIKMRKLGWRSEESCILVSPKEATGNLHLLRYFEKYFRVVTSASGAAVLQNFAGYADIGGAAIMSNGQHQMFTPAIRLACEKWDTEGLPPLFVLTEQDSVRGENCLRQLGVPPSAEIVCLHVRDKGLYEDTWSLRNSEISTYFSGIQKMVDAGYWVVRMGDPSMEALPDLANVIDYAHSSLRSDWMDVFLCGRCSFFVGTQSGLGHVPPLFGKSCLLTNWTTWGILPYMPQDIFVPKLLRDISSGKILNAAESIAEPFGFIQDKRHLNCYGMELIDNTTDDIEDSIEEMMRHVRSPEGARARKLSPAQIRFREIEKKSGCYGCSSQIAESFLAKHPYLMEC